MVYPSAGGKWNDYAAVVEDREVFRCSSTSPDAFERRFRMAELLPVGETVTVTTVICLDRGNKIVRAQPMTRLA